MNIVLPYVFVMMMLCYYDSLHLEETRAKFGAIYANASLTYFDGEKKLELKRKDILIFPLIFCLRRTMFVLTCVIWE